MGKALYRTHRPKRLSEIVGQEHITQALNNALTQGSIAHAYLFTGPRGTGKTSIARILAHEINGLLYDDDSVHLDIIEIDAASNRRIDEIRDLRDKVHVAPTSGKFKIYIIDEVHMLTREAFNALLKTLEEPPAHVVFILATTEVQKLPETIISRTQRFTFKPIERAKLVAALRAIATPEKIEIDDAALELVAAHGEGSFRDSLSLLDQIRNVGHAVAVGDIENLLGIAPIELIREVTSGLQEHNASKVVQALQKLQAQGSQPVQVAKQLGQALRAQLLGGTSPLAHEQLFTLLARLIEVPASADPGTFLEIALLDVALAETTPLAPAPKAATPTPQPAPQKIAHETVQPTAAVHVETLTHPATKAKAEKIAAEKVEIPQAKSGSKVAATKLPAEESPPDTVKTEPIQDIENAPTLDAAIWPGILHKVKQKYNTLYSILRTAEPHFGADSVELEVGYAFHQKRLSDPKSKNLVADVIKELTGQDVTVTVKLGKPKAVGISLPDVENGGEQSHTVSSASVSDRPADAPDDTPKDDVDYYVQEAEKAAVRPVDVISDVFGGGELLDT